MSSNLGRAVIGFIMLGMFLYLQPLVSSFEGVTVGEQIIIILILGYGAMVGVLVGVEALAEILVDTMKWFFYDTKIGKEWAVKLKKKMDEPFFPN